MFELKRTCPPGVCLVKSPQECICIKIKGLYYRVFKKYRRLEIKCCTYATGDILIRQNVGKPECEQWVLAIPEEDRNRVIGVVYLERRERIVM